MNSSQKGDWAQIDGVTGVVTVRSPFALKFSTAKKHSVSIPSAKIIAAQIHIYSKEVKGLHTFLHTSITAGHDVRW